VRRTHLVGCRRVLAARLVGDEATREVGLSALRQIAGAAAQRRSTREVARLTPEQIDAALEVLAAQSPELTQRIKDARRSNPEWIAERDNPASSSPGDDENIPSFVVFNLAGGYKHANGTYAQLNINNVFDEEHSFGGFGNRWGFERGESVNAQLRAGWRF